MAKTPLKTIVRQTIIGQERIQTLLAESIRGNRIAHAYLFSGQRGIGKAAVALDFARKLLCSRQDHAPCEECEDCRLSVFLQHPDLHLVIPVPPSRKSSSKDSDEDDDEENEGALADPTSNLIGQMSKDPYTPIILENPKKKGTDERKQRSAAHIIKIGQIRVLLRTASLKPYQASRKVFVLFHADAMNTNAQNAFLKALEEPPSAAYFLLTTENELALQLTVRSRCQRIPVSPLQRETIIGGLMADGIEPDRARMAASLSGGSFVRARELAGSELDVLQSRIMDYFKAAATCDPVKLPAVVADLLEASTLPRETSLELLALFFREIALYRSTSENPNGCLIFEVHRKTIAGIQSAFPHADWEKAIESVDEAAQFLARGYTEHFVLFALAIQIRESLGSRSSVKKHQTIHA